MASCSDFLDQYSPSELTEEVVYNSAEYTKQAVNRIYTHLTKDHMYGARLPPDRKSTRLNSIHRSLSRIPSSA